MSFQNTWERFTADWKSFAVIALGHFLAWLIVRVPLEGPVMYVEMHLTMLLSRHPVGYVLRGGPSFWRMMPVEVVALVLLIVGVLVMAFAVAGTMGSLVAYRRGEAITLGLFFRLAWRYWARMLGLTGLNCAILLLVLLLMIIPLIGCLALLLVSPLVCVYGCIYPSYMIVAEEKGVREAIGASLTALTLDLKEAAVGGGTWALAFLAIAVSCLILGLVPLVGRVASAALMYFANVVIIYYFTERFETNVRPLLNG